MQQETNTWKTERKTYIFFFVVFSIGFFYLNFITAKQKTDFSQSDLIKIDKLILKETPQINNGRRHKDLKLKFINYENVFVFDDYDNYILPKDIIYNNFKIGDTLSLKILTSESKNLTTNFIAKNIEIYSILKNQENYLDLVSKSKTINGIDAYKLNLTPAFIFISLMSLLFAFLPRKPRLKPNMILLIGSIIITIFASS